MIYLHLRMTRPMVNILDSDWNQSPHAKKQDQFRAISDTQLPQERHQTLSNTYLKFSTQMNEFSDVSVNVFSCRKCRRQRKELK